MKTLFLMLVVISVGIGVSLSYVVGANEESFAQRFVSGGKKPKVEGVSGTYSFDKAHSSIGFMVKHMGLVSVPGYFRDFAGTINYVADDVTKSSVTFSAKTKSVDTGIGGRDNHLRTADFFEVEKYPEMTFKSTRIQKKGKKYLVFGDLTIKGVTKQINFPFQIAGFLSDPKMGTKMGAVAETNINRRDFGVNYGSNLPNGVAAISDEIRILLQIEANLPAAAPAK